MIFDKNKSLILGLIALVFSSSTYAHDMDGSGFVAGFTHPVLGFDHLLAMLSVGVLSAQMGGRSIWSVPLTFVMVMVIGGTMGIFGVPFMEVEIGIAISVLALGVALAIERKLPPFIAMGFVALFAVFHGYAHGAEMPYLASPVKYAFGFVVGTTCIHLAGVLIGVVTNKISNGARILRYVGASIAGIGFHILIS